MEYDIIKYKALEYYSIGYHYDGTYDLRNLGIGNAAIAKNCVAVFPSEKTNFLPSYRIKDNIDYCECEAPSKIFIHPECVTRRDIFRNSGYEIKIKPDNAKHYIIPNPFSYKIFDKIELVAYHEKSGLLQLYHIAHNKEDRIQIKNIYASDLNELRKRFEGEGYKVYTVAPYRDTDDYTFSVEIFRDNECWWEILKAGKYGAAKYHYVLESKVEMLASVNISPETLLMWKNMTQENAEISICNSDWKEYPYTVWSFIKIAFKDYYSLNKMFRFVRRTLGEDKFLPKTVSPKDWNMLQDFICTLANGTTQMGYATANIKKEFLNLIPHRMMIKPMKIDHEMTQEELRNKLQNA